MVSVTESYDEMFQNWLVHFERLNLNMQVFVFAEDQFIYEKYNKNSSFVLKRSQFGKVKSIHSIRSYMGKWAVKFLSTPALLKFLILSPLRNMTDRHGFGPKFSGPRPIWAGPAQPKLVGLGLGQTHSLIDGFGPKFSGPRPIWAGPNWLGLGLGQAQTYP